jgi:hypothetical protein
VFVMRKMIKFTLTTAEVDEIEEGLVEWVMLYERYVNAQSCHRGCANRIP